jgi:hypothetical protein
MIQRCNPVKVLLSLRVQRPRTRKKNPKPKEQEKQTNPIPSFLSPPSPPPQAPSLAPDPQCNSRRLVPSLLLVYKQKTQPPAGIRQWTPRLPCVRRRRRSNSSSWLQVVYCFLEVRNTWHAPMLQLTNAATGSICWSWSTSFLKQDSGSDVVVINHAVCFYN